MNNLENLIIGEGLGPAKFGMNKDEIIELLGEPDEVDEDDYDDIEIITLFYDEIETDFTFELIEDEEGFSEYILRSILSVNKKLKIDNKIKYGDSVETLLKYTRTLKADEPEIEFNKESNENLYYFDSLSLLAIFDSNNKLTGIEIGCWDDDEEMEEEE